jgi:hypothetical protein
MSKWFSLLPARLSPGDTIVLFTFAFSFFLGTSIALKYELGKRK